MTRIFPPTNRLKPTGADIAFLKIGDRRPQQTVVLKSKIFQLPLAQFATDLGAVNRTVQVNAQDLSFATLSLADFTSLFMPG